MDKEKVIVLNVQDMINTATERKKNAKNAHTRETKSLKEKENILKKLPAVISSQKQTKSTEAKRKVSIKKSNTERDIAEWNVTVAKQSLEQSTQVLNQATEHLTNLENIIKSNNKLNNKLNNKYYQMKYMKYKSLYMKYKSS